MKKIKLFNLDKIVAIGLYLFIFLFFWQTRLILHAGEIKGGPWEYGSISLYASDILLLTLLFLQLLNIFFHWRKGKYNFKIGFYWYFIAVLELCVLVSIFFAPSKYLAIYGYLRLLLGIGLFWLMVSAKYRKKLLIGSFLLAVFIQIIFGIWQFYVQHIEANTILGISEHKPYNLGNSVVEAMGNIGFFERWLRAYAAFDHPNIFGGVLTMAILLFIYYIIKMAPKFYERYELGTLAYVIAYRLFIVVAIVALVFSFSRAAWLALAVGILIMAAISLCRRDLLREDVLAKIILLISMTAFLLTLIYGNIIFVRFNGQSRQEVRSKVERIVGIKESWKLVSQHWLLGLGINNYTLVLKDNIPEKRNSYYYQPVHVSYLLILAELGIFGLLAFLALIMYPLVYLWKLWQRKKDFSIYLLAIWLAFIILLSLDHWWWSLHFGIFFFWFILGFLISELPAFKKKKKLDN